MGDGGHPHRHVVGLERHIAVALPKRRFGFEPLRIDQPFDHDLRRCRNIEVDRPRLGDLDRCAGDRAGHAELVHVDGELLRSREHHDGSAADHDRDRHRLAPLPVFQPVQVAAGAARLARYHAHDQPVGRFQGRAVGAHVLNAAVGIAGDAQRCGQIGRGVEAGRGDRHRQPQQPARCRERIPGEHLLLAGRRMDPRRRNRIGDRPHPGAADFRDRLPHADGVNVGRSGKRADHDRDIVAPTLGVGDVGEQERSPLVLGNAAQELPAHQRMQLGILVDRPLDAHQQAVGLEIGQVMLEIEPRAAALQRGARRDGRLIQHLGRSRVS